MHSSRLMKQAILGLVCFTSCMLCAATSRPVTDGQRRERKRPFYDLPSKEMQEKLRIRNHRDRDRPDFTNEQKELTLIVGTAIYESKKLAEDYFAGGISVRKRLSARGCLHPLRALPYRIIRTIHLEPVLEKPKAGGQMDLAWLRKQFSGPYKGIFLVQPQKEKGTLEKCVILFPVEGGKRLITKVTKDEKFDPAGYLLTQERANIRQYLRGVLKGAHKRVLQHLPDGEYGYLDAPNYGVGAVEFTGLPESTTLPSNTHDCALTLYEKGKTPAMWTKERLFLRVEKKNKGWAVSRCVRDQKQAKRMEQQLKIADFVVSFVASSVEGRKKLLTEQGKSELMQPATIRAVDLRTLALDVRQVKRSGDLTAGDPGYGKLWDVVCHVELKGDPPKRSRFRFRVGVSDDGNIRMVTVRITH